METCAQRSVKHCLGMIAPFEASEKRLEKGQFQFYQLMVSIYRGMYERPEEYLVFPAPYEEYVMTRKQKAPQKKKEKEHASDPRESTLRNTFQQAIQFYALFFYRVGLSSEGVDGQSGALVISKEKYSGVLDQLDRIRDAKYNAARYEVLSRLGIQIRESGGRVSIQYKGRRQAMAGALYLCKAPDSKYKWMNFLRLDFKNAYSPIPKVADICQTLPPESRKAVKKLESSLAGMKIKTKIKPLRGIVSDFHWKVEYSYQGKNICGFYADNEYFMMCIYFNRFQNITDFAKVLQEEDHNLFLWFRNQFPERLCQCPNNRRVYFDGEPRRICGLSNRAEIVDPDDADLEKGLYVLKKYQNLHRE